MGKGEGDGWGGRRNEGSNSKRGRRVERGKVGRGGNAEGHEASGGVERGGSVSRVEEGREEPGVGGAG